jgi:hypothetical protein
MSTEIDSTLSSEIDPTLASPYNEASTTAASAPKETPDVFDDAADAIDQPGHDRARGTGKPALMIGGGIALGFLLSRILKTSAGDRRRR